MYLECCCLLCKSVKPFKTTNTDLLFQKELCQHRESNHGSQAISWRLEVKVSLSLFVYMCVWLMFWLKIHQSGNNDSLLWCCHRIKVCYSTCSAVTLICQACLLVLMWKYTIIYAHGIEPWIKWAWKNKTSFPVYCLLPHGSPRAWLYDDSHPQVYWASW